MIHVGDVIGYAAAPDALSGLYVRSALILVASTAAAAPSVLGATKDPDEFWIDAKLRPAALASLKSTYPMAPSVEEIACATPALPCAAWKFALPLPEDPLFELLPHAASKSIGARSATSVRLVRGERNVAIKV